jgi:hypothetical protein
VEAAQNMRKDLGNDGYCVLSSSFSDEEKWGGGGTQQDW